LGWEKPVEQMTMEQLVSVLLTVDGKGREEKRKALVRIVSMSYDKAYEDVFSKAVAGYRKE
jgi:hypothetical protein